MVAKDRPKNTGSPKGVVGEIDTSAPFQSVKDAVNLFGEGAFSGEKPAIKKAKAYSAERVLAKETQLHLVQKELNKLKDQIKNAETTKAQALSDLEKAKKTVHDLTGMLNAVSISKDSAVKATEAAESHVKQIEETRNSNSSSGSYDYQKPNLGKEYVSAIAEIDAAKKELWRIRHDYGASEDAKAAAIKQAIEAELAAKEYLQKAKELSNEISAVGESIEQVKIANLHTLEEEAKLYTEKDLLKQSYTTKVEESRKKLVALKEAIDPVLLQNLESRLGDTESQVDRVRKEIGNTRNSDLDFLKTVTIELDDAKESLQKATEEEITIRRLLEMLKIELEDVKKEHAELKVKEAETESVAGDLHVKLRKAKSELEAALAEESRVQDASVEMISTLDQLTSESELARHDAEEMKKQAEELKKEAESNRILLETTEENLNNALIEAEEAKAAEIRVIEQVKALSDRTNAARASTSDSGDKIMISKDEYESLSGKVTESEKLAEMKVAAAMAQVEAVKASENEVLKKLEATQKEINDMKAATQEALKRAEMAEAAKKAVEGELRRWREREQKKLAEAAARILAENDALLTSSSPSNYQVEKQPNSADKVAQAPKLERSKTSARRKVLMPSITGIFFRKKNQVKGGSPSLIPG